jgi:hypothetical protein
MLKYLVEEKGADISLENVRGESGWDLVLRTNDVTYFKYFLSVREGVPKSVDELAPSDEWESPDEDEAAMMMAETHLRREIRKQEAAAAKVAREAEAKALFDEQEAKANEATAALLADLDAEDQRAAAAAAAGKKNTKKSNKKKKKEAGSQQLVPSARSVTDRAPNLEESKADDKKLAPQPSSQMEEEEQQQLEQVEEEGASPPPPPPPQQQQQQQEEERRRRRGAPQRKAAVAAMGDLRLKEEKGADAPISATATREGEVEDGIGEKDLEEEKHDFFFDGAPDSLKCSVGFCLMTEAVLAMDEFSYRKSSLEKHIAHCATKGLSLTSPLTCEPMGGMFMPNQNLRTLVKDYIAQREKEWELHLAQQRAAAAESEKKV